MGSGVVELHDPESITSQSSAIDHDDENELLEKKITATTVRPNLESETKDSASILSSSKSKFKLSNDKQEWHADHPTGQTVQIVVSPTKSYILHFFHWLEGLAIVSCLGVLTTQLLPLVLLISPDQELGFLQILLRVYISVFAIAFILVELRVPWDFLKKSHLLQVYFSRGLLYTFLGVIGLEEAFSGRVDDMVHHSTSEFHVAWAPLFMQISSWFVFGIGLVHMLFGICCLQRLRDNLDQKYKKQMEEFQRMHNELVA
jgi:hypothetical protein